MNIHICESLYRGKQGDYRLYRLENRYNGRPLPKVSIVDMKEELKMGNDLSLSDELRMAIADNIASDKQTILLLNRRGNSRCLVCVDCREIPNCRRCDQKLTYHSANNRLMCHYCGFSQEATRSCPKCGGAVKRVGTGTQKVQEELQELFPWVETMRMDTDTVSAAHPHEELLEKFRKKNIP